MDELNITSRQVLREIAAIAMARATDLVAVEDGQLVVRPTDQLSDSQAAAICSIEKSSGCLKVKFYDKLKALELLGKHLALFENKMPDADPENDLLQTILDSTKEVIDTHDLPEIQQAAAAGNDLVEPPGP